MWNFLGQEVNPRHSSHNCQIPNMLSHQGTPAGCYSCPSPSIMKGTIKWTINTVRREPRLACPWNTINNQKFVQTCADKRHCLTQRISLLISSGGWLCKRTTRKRQSSHLGEKSERHPWGFCPGRAFSLILTICSLAVSSYILHSFVPSR